MKYKLGIRFSDNDFHNTIVGFLRVFHDGIMWNHLDVADELTKPRIVALFNNLAPSLYILYQNWYRDVGYEFDPSYIQITDEHVFIDDEVNKYLLYLKESRCGNGEFHYYDYEGTLNSEMTGQRLEPVIVTV